MLWRGFVCGCEAREAVGGIGKAVATIGRIAMQRRGCLHCSGRMFDRAWISPNTDGAGR